MLSNFNTLNTKIQRCKKKTIQNECYLIQVQDLFEEVKIYLQSSCVKRLLKWNCGVTRADKMELGLRFMRSLHIKRRTKWQSKRKNK